MTTWAHACLRIQCGCSAYAIQRTVVDLLLKIKPYVCETAAIESIRAVQPAAQASKMERSPINREMASFTRLPSTLFADYEHRIWVRIKSPR